MHGAPPGADAAQPERRPRATASALLTFGQPAAPRGAQADVAPAPRSSTSPSLEHTARSATPSANASGASSAGRRSRAPWPPAAARRAAPATAGRARRPARRARAAARGGSSAQASPVFWRMPRDSSAGRKSARAVSPSRSSSASMRVLDAVARDAVGERDELEVLADGEVVVEQRRVGHERQRRARRLGVGLVCGSWPQMRTVPSLGSAARRSCAPRSTCRCRWRRSARRTRPRASSRSSRSSPTRRP